MELPPDPYIALGVPKDATPAAIKTAHRKLVLKFHPDKVTDPAAKEAASDQFHRIQTAYEILIDEDRRGRYDAQVRLQSLRKEAMERKGSGSVRGGDMRSSSTPYRPSAEPTSRSGYNTRSSERVAPQYEERRPSYAADYFDPKPRSSTRKEPEYERSSRRPATESKEKPRSTRDSKTKENERDRRKEKSRKTEKETKKERDHKYSAYAEDDASESDSDEHMRRERRMRDEDTERRAREYYSRQRPENNDPYHDERARKMASQAADIRDYISSSKSRPRAEPERRPSPPRGASSKDKLEHIQRSDGRSVPVMVRRSSARPKQTSRDSDFQHGPSPERRRSDESLPELPRRPPTLAQHKSSPADIRMPESKQRSQSVQVESENGPRVPQMKRSETAPYTSSSRRPEPTVQSKGSAQRPTIVTDGIATPAVTPENVTPPAMNSKYNYGKQYADDKEYATPDGYRTEVREPVSGKPTRPRLTRSPEPMKESREARGPRDVRDRDLPRDIRGDRDRSGRSASARHPSSPQVTPQMPRTTSYVYNVSDRGVEQTDRSARPGLSHRESSRPEMPRDANLLFAEVPTTKTAGSPRQRPMQYPPTVPEDGVSRQKAVRPEDVRMASGYTSRKAGVSERPSLGRNTSSYYGAGVRA
ncbi:unnamed protein product [Zymoseptoria tritici ST99CH_3D7]|uniref:J domain-containing protein n=1 Tax=Zymoseptoria tritici (strain ST99CH_3D7) TaxID=1276538 RepID=A0A1X7RTC6_ZYMT9|nr:unnamed protein product [Zymoseptoria tritici ST99CH_3D7]